MTTFDKHLSKKGMSCIERGMIMQGGASEWRVHSTEGDSIREGLWHQRFPKMAKSNSLSFMVLFMCKKHVIKHRINI